MKETRIDSANGAFVSFASTRPSRASQVLSNAQDLEMRRVCEQAWFEDIGVDPALVQQLGFGKTGSPTGSKYPHTLDDFVEDFGPLG